MIIFPANKDTFTSFFPVYMFFISSLITLARTSYAMSERIGENTHPSVVSDLQRKVVSLSQLRMISAIDFFHFLFIGLKKFPSITTLMSVFIKSRYGFCQMLLLNMLRYYGLSILVCSYGALH